MSFLTITQNPKYSQPYFAKIKINEHRNGSQAIQNKNNNKHKKLSSLVEKIDLQNLQIAILQNESFRDSCLRNKNFIVQQLPFQKKQDLKLGKLLNLVKVLQTAKLNIKQKINDDSQTKNSNKNVNKTNSLFSNIQYLNQWDNSKNVSDLNIVQNSQSDLKSKKQMLKLSLPQHLAFTKTYKNQLEFTHQSFTKESSSAKLSKSSFDNSLQEVPASQISITDYQLLKTLGEGSYGKVALYQHIKSNFVCAIKQIQKSKIHQQAIQYIIRQIKIQSIINHPNIVKVYTCFTDQKSIYIVMEPCIQGNIYSQLLKKQKFSQKQLKKLMKQMCSALNYIHDLDIMHRDIKPQNILLHQGVYKICDFGWAIQVPLSRGTSCGTAIYSSPEIVQESVYDSKIDIWNLGIMAYQLLVGTIPFQIACKEDLKNILHQKVRFPVNLQISDKCKDFIFKCLQKDPKKRCSIKRLIDHEFLQ